MYAIKMEADKSLVTTLRTAIYRGENNADVITFFLPQVYGDKNIADFSIFVRYILPDGTGKSEALVRDPIPYNQDYYRFHLDLSTRLTETDGTIQLWLTAIDSNDNTVLKTGSTTVKVLPSRNIASYLSFDQLDQLDQLELQMARLKREKADGLLFDAERNSLQLASGELEVGGKVILNGGGSGEIGAIQRIDGGTAAGV